MGFTNRNPCCTMNLKGWYSTMVYNQVEIKAIQLSLGNLENQGISVKEVLLHSIDWLDEKYKATADIRYIYKAIWHIFAYLEFGFLYDDGKDRFCEIVKCVRKKPEEIFADYINKYKIVPLKKSAIRKLLGRWNPKLHSMKIEDAVNDIIEKVTKKELGKFLYHSGKVIVENDKASLWEHTFWLFIKEDEILFYDVNKNIYYMIK